MINANQMKNLLNLIVAGVIGGLVAFFAFQHFDKDTVIYEQSPAQTFTTNTSSHSDVLPFDFVKAAERVNPAVVHISAENEEYKQYQNRSDSWGVFRWRNGERPEAGTGSGVLISEDGFIVTNNHVVGFADYMEVTMHDGQRYKAVNVGTDPSTDLAVIKIEGESFPHLKVGNSDDVKVGQWVVAVGNPFNLTSTVTAGIVSAKGRDLGIIQGLKAIEEFIQTDAVVNPGNSGGALVDVEGNLIGINTAISSPTGVYAGYSFAIPSNLVGQVIDEIMEKGGDIKRGMLGISIVDVSVIDKEEYDPGIDYGVLISEFAYRTDSYGRKILFSSAKKAGLEIGDVITGVDGSLITGADELQESLKFTKIGDTVDVEVHRDGRKKTIPVKITVGI